jgi:hypothetical protein
MAMQSFEDDELLDVKPTQQKPTTAAAADRSRADSQTSGTGEQPKPQATAAASRQPLATKSEDFEDESAARSSR